MEQPCSQCGNILPAWANGVCQVCARIDAEAQRYGTARSSRSRRSLDLDLPLDHDRLPSMPPTAAPADSGDAGFRAQLHGINRFLTAVYGRPVLLSQLLRAQGLAPAQLDAWRADHAWMAGYVERVVAHLAALWTASAPAAPVAVLWAWYGIGRPQLRTPALIADALGLSFTTVVQAHPAVLAALQQPAGRAALEAGLAAAATGPSTVADHASREAGDG